MVINSGAFKKNENGRSYVTDGIRKHTGPFIIAQGPVDLPDGSIGTSEIAAGAASALIGNYRADTSWSTTTTGVWLSTALTTGSIACSGAPCRVEVNVTMVHSVVGATYYTGLMVDGGALWSMSYTNQPGANYSLPISWVTYFTPGVGNHTFALGVYNGAAGTLSIFSGVNSSIYVTEQRR